MAKSLGISRKLGIVLDPRGGTEPVVKALSAGCRLGDDLYEIIYLRKLLGMTGR